MAVKSIVDIDIKDAAFKRYTDSFKAYQSMLSKTPEAWKNVTKEIDNSRASFQKLVAAAAARQGYAKLTAEAESVASRHLERAERSWRNIAQSTQRFATHVVTATRELLRWAGALGIISGLLGGGGLMGIGRLATAAAGQRRDALGMGITPGQNAAFQLNYGRLVNTQSVLGGVHEAITDPTKRAGLLRAGLSESQIQGKDAAQVSMMLIEQVKTLVDKIPTNQLGLHVSQVERLGELGLTLEDLERIKRTSRSEISRYGKDTLADRPRLELDRGTQDAWDNFKKQLALAAGVLENNFIKILTPLTGPLTKLSEAFLRLADSVLGGKAGQDLIKNISDGVDGLAKTIGRPEFRKGVEEFATNIVKVANATANALKYIAGWVSQEDKGRRDQPGDLGPGLGPGPNEPTPKETDQAASVWMRALLEAIKNLTTKMGNSPAVVSPMGGTPLVGGGGGAARIWEAMSRTGGGTRGAAGPVGGAGVPGRGGTGSWTGSSRQQAGQAALEYYIAMGATPEQAAGLAAAEMNESGGNPRAVGDNGNSVGAYQWSATRRAAIMRGTGIDISTASIEEQRRAAWWELHNSPSERGALAAWSKAKTAREAGAAITGFERPKDRAGRERADADEAEWILNHRGRGGGTSSWSGGRPQAFNINIYNHTGGSAIVTAAAMPA